MSVNKVSEAKSVDELEVRLAIINSAVQQRLQRKVESVSSLGRDSNNYVHLVHLENAGEHHSNAEISPQAGTSPLDPSVTKIVIRISNPAAMLDDKVRVENEVAAVALMRRALATTPRTIVPKVYAWKPAGKGSGWIAQEYLEGKQLSAHTTKLPADKVTFVVDQVAELFAKIQRFDPQVAGFGGLRFDLNGEVVTGRSTLWSIGPFHKYSEMYHGIFVKQTSSAATTPLLEGWKGTDLLERLKNFSVSAVWKALLGKFDGFKPTLVHGDLSFDNILVDPETLQITGLLDYDFSHIAAPADEFVYSFMELGGLVPGPFEDEALRSLRRFQLGQGEDDLLPEETEDSPVNWTLAKAWNSALKKHGVNGPAEIENIADLADIYWFLLDVCPPFFNMPKWLAKRTDKQKQAAKARTEKILHKYIDRWTS
ncbi:hypothetical protein AUEXF2481DRAFT_43007 [Aureobasidium subglaciale EXF-2481]|uniref:Aminoglycoside phosphotransferase domain-containing protein n=1 Tax=Aureobasidium subglaciale (strain EXF-2481) TaxID=1043005 RepID=A0A074Y9C3_AURSE|nr:uncharacterized protein AUEXF2481DRAFT_43007 [Aureobasidium subglaciale EXF-2481]KAI5197064.1 hypothetical protein E4T38_08179 [Aureobasidium subglaciale]KAI5215761.1 hypothetical protein E4T40_08189 [Aureobasidium subglaciale]KAI5219016.1 hypothetical protein E4T41_08104 [Aureobasidium subglaciale]KAI5256610.1 hypothetical protein E4T46_08080 [Aureobasidium subglaciale]KEQ92569.1 hypothetical protein AUEXF2481DRAFT_43007 [Aureobasidium subglaciale EXF-2481]